MGYGYGLEQMNSDGTTTPLCLGEEWVVFPNRVAARLVKDLLEATTCIDFWIVDLQKRFQEEAEASKVYQR